MPQGLYVPFSCALPRDPKMRAAGPLADRQEVARRLIEDGQI